MAVKVSLLIHLFLFLVRSEDILGLKRVFKVFPGVSLTSSENKLRNN
jgi:hypothetical protein